MARGEPGGCDKGQIAPGTEPDPAESIACRVDQEIRTTHLGQRTVKCELLTGTCPVCAVKIAQNGVSSAQQRLLA